MNFSFLSHQPTGLRTYVSLVLALALAGLTLAGGPMLLGAFTTSGLVA
jgi:hypothetical protein